MTWEAWAVAFLAMTICGGITGARLADWIERKVKSAKPPAQPKASKVGAQ